MHNKSLQQNFSRVRSPDFSLPDDTPDQSCANKIGIDLGQLALSVPRTAGYKVYLAVDSCVYYRVNRLGIDSHIQTSQQILQIGSIQNKSHLLFNWPAWGCLKLVQIHIAIWKLPSQETVTKTVTTTKQILPKLYIHSLWQKLPLAV